MNRDKEIIAVFEIPTLVSPPPGERTTNSAQGIDFHMRLAPASTFPAGTVNIDFWIAETQVTYELWYAVRMWR